MMFLKIGVTAMIVLFATVFIAKHLNAPSDRAETVVNVFVMLALFASVVSFVVSAWVLL